jgi:hypothetical protein
MSARSGRAWRSLRYRPRVWAASFAWTRAQRPLTDLARLRWRLVRNAYDGGGQDADSRVRELLPVDGCGRGRTTETTLLSRRAVSRPLFPHPPERSLFNRRRRQLAPGLNAIRQGMLAAVAVAQDRHCAIDSLLTGARQIVETANDQLPEHFGPARHHVHTFPGLCARLYTKLTPHLYLSQPAPGSAPLLQIKAFAFPD